MITLIVLAVIGIAVFNKKAIPASQNKASENLNTVGNPSTSSSTPIPTPSANSPTATPPFYQQKNAATPSEPHTTQSFDPVDLSAPISGSQDRQGTVAPSLRTPTVHNNVILAKTFNQRLSSIQKPIAGPKQFINDTELSSVGEEQSIAYGPNNGTPDITESDRKPYFNAANIKNAGGSNGTHPATPHAGILQYAHRLAPTPPKQATIEKTVPKIASRVVKSSLKPAARVTTPNRTFFNPVDRLK